MPGPWVPLAEVARPHGVRGELRLRLFNRDSDLLLSLDEVLVRFPDGREEEVSVDAARRANDAILMKLYSVDDRDGAEGLRGAPSARAERLPRARAGRVSTLRHRGSASGPSQRTTGSTRDLGRVKELRTYPTTSALLVEAGDGTALRRTPLVDSVVQSVDVDVSLVTLRTMDGVEKARGEVAFFNRARRHRDVVSRGLHRFPRDELRVPRDRARPAGGAISGSPRDTGLGNHRSVDDAPYGGGSGMVMRIDVLVAAFESLDGDAPGGVLAHRILMTPQGRPLDQQKMHELAKRPAVMLVRGRYEGFDDRTRAWVAEEISLGDFVLAGGEVAAMAIVDGCSRLLPGVLGNEASVVEESHSAEGEGLLEYPQYTRPVEFRGSRVPEVLQGGNHAEIARWRKRAGRAPYPRAPPGHLEPRRASKAGSVRRCAVALVHHPVLDGQGAVVTSAVTNLDVHDLARNRLGRMV